MYESLKKDEALPLPDQISNIIRQKIEVGEYHPGKKLGTIRQFAKDFAVSPVTIIKALDILEEETLIERVPVKGVFVSEKLKPQKKQLAGCFVFPEKYMFPQPAANENWGLNYELYRGLLEAAQQRKINMQFVYFEDVPPAEVFEKQKIALRKFDFAIFPGAMQLSELCNASALERPTYCFASGNNTAEMSEEVIRIDYDRENVTKYLIDYLLKSSCVSAGAISCVNYQTSRAADFLDAARNNNIKVSGSSWLQLEKDDENAMQKIKEYLLSRKHEFIFVDYTEVVPMIYEAAYQGGLTVGKDFILTGVASGLTFAGLFPRLSYFRIPRYEMGINIMDMAEKLVRNGKKTGNFPTLKLEFVKGHCYKINQS